MVDTIKDMGVIIRKDHHCWGCTILFHKGTFMTAVVSVDMGKIGTCYYCPKCMAYMAEHSEDLDYGVEYGDFLNDEEYKNSLFKDGG
jgi:hypothetical protein